LYKCFLLIAGLTIAIKSRDVVNLPQYSERHQLGYAIYNLILCTVVVVPATYLLRAQPDSAYIFRAVGIFTAAMVSLFAIFVPKILTVYGIINNEIPLTGVKSGPSSPVGSNRSGNDKSPIRAGHSSEADSPFHQPSQDVGDEKI